MSDTIVELPVVPTDSRAPQVPQFLVNVLARSSVYAWLVALVVVPNALLLVTSFLSSSDGAVLLQPTLDNYASVFGSATVQVLALRTVMISASSALGATLIAYPLAYYISRRLSGGKTIAALLIVIPLSISLLMRIFAWRVILDEHGVLNTGLVDLGILSAPSSAFLYTRFSVILVLTSVAIPYVFVAAYAAIERVPFSLIEAAQDNGASPFRAFTTIIWPLTRQGTAIGIALAFLAAMGDYVTPSMVGGINGTTLGMVISSEFGFAGNWPLGAAMAVYILVIVVAILGVLFWLMRSKGVLTEVDVGVSVPVSAWAELSNVQRCLRVAGRALFVLPYVFMYVPLVVIMLFSFNDSSVQSLPFKGFTMRWYEGILSDSGMLTAVVRSLTLASIATSIGVVVGTVFAFMFVGWRGRGSMVTENLLALPLAVPGVVLGISMVMAASAVGIQPGMGRLILGHVVFVMPVIMLIILARLRRVDPSFASASRDLGANAWTTFWRVQLPMIRGAIVGGALLGFTMSIDEVIVTLFLGGDQPTLPVYVWDQTRFGFTPSVNAIFTCIGALTLILVFFAQLLINPSAKRAGG
jgi:ABC-type spermidine/putrescine transport system permease subunit II